jgi:hypothetical protein
LGLPSLEGDQGDFKFYCGGPFSAVVIFFWDQNSEGDDDGMEVSATGICPAYYLDGFVWSYYWSNVGGSWCASCCSSDGVPTLTVSHSRMDLKGMGLVQYSYEVFYYPLPVPKAIQEVDQ